MAAALSSPWRLFKISVRDYRQNLKSLILILSVVFVPTSIISTYIVQGSADTTLAAYVTFAQLVGDTALIYAVTRLVEGQSTGLKQAYFEGSAPIVRLIIVTFLLVLMLLPLVIGLVILGTGVVAPGAPLGFVERFLLSTLALVISIPTFIFLARSFMSIYVIFETNLGPIAAIRRSRALTKGHVRSTLARLLVLVLLLVVILIIPVAGLKLLQTYLSWSFFDLLSQLILAAVVLPTSTLYLYRYYLELKHGQG